MKSQNWMLIGIASLIIFGMGFVLSERNTAMQNRAALESAQSQQDETAKAVAAANQAADIYQRAAAEWRKRAEACEAGRTIGTIVYIPQAAASIPLAGGLASFNLGLGQRSAPALFIPQQAQVYSPLPGVTYVWQDMKTLELKGTFQAMPLSAAGKGQ